MDHKSIWNCDYNFNMTVPKGTKILLSNVWSYEGNHLTPGKDIIISLDEENTLLNALCRVEAAALKYVQLCGAQDIRQYFIEDVKRTSGMIEFIVGT